MLLVAHVFIAITSVIFSLYMMLTPSRTKLKVSFGLIAATLSTGTVLVWFTRTPITSVCTTGLIYIGTSLLGVIIARRKLAYKQHRIQE